MNAFLSRISIFAVLTLASVSFAACSGNKANLSGHIIMDVDTILVGYAYFTNDENYVTDTVVLAEDGYFEICLPDTAVMAVTIFSTTAEWSDFAEVMIFPGDRVTVEGSIADLKVSGTKLYDSLNDSGLLDMEKRLGAIEKELLSVAYSGDDNAKRDSLARLYNASFSEFIAACRDFIKENPDNIACAYAFTVLNSDQCVEDYELVGENVKGSPAGQVIEYYYNLAKEDLATEEAWNRLEPGVPAPDFRLKNLDGEYMTLDSFKGKYVLLDFWGTWCGWCIKGIPDMKAYYEKYKDKIEFVGIDCRDTEEEWREGVKKHELPWVNLYNGEDTGIVMAYGVQGYPTKIIIDPEGKVVQAFMGESPELYDKLDEMFK